jgi:hypothetical protein
MEVPPPTELWGEVEETGEPELDVAPEAAAGAELPELLFDVALERPGISCPTTATIAATDANAAAVVQRNARRTRPKAMVR